MSTTTFNPDASPESTSVDGVATSNVDATWSIAYNEAGTGANHTSPSIQPYAQKNGSNYDIVRAFLYFDTSSLPDNAVIDSATIDLYKVSYSDSDSSSLVLTSATLASNTTVAASDFAKANFGSTEFSSRYALSSGNNNTYNTVFTLNASGLAAISLTGITKFGIRNSRDFDNSAPTGNDAFTFQSADGTNKPNLNVTYHIPYSTSVSDSFSISDSQLTSRGVITNVNETITLSQTVSTLRSVIISIAETIGLTDVLSFIQTLLWNNASRDSTSFSGGTKHSSSWTDSTKDNTTFTNLPK